MYKYVFLIIFAISFNLNAQVTTTIFPDGSAFKEFPFLNQIHNEEIPLYTMPSFNLDSIIHKERELDKKGVGRPFRFGYDFDVSYEMEHGRWRKVGDKNIWNIRFKSDGAYTLNFRMSNLKLNDKSELYIYNSNGTFIYGAVTYKQNSTNEFSSIGTDLIAGEEAIIQIIEPKAFMQSSTIRITKIVHGFENHYKEILHSNKKEGDNFQAILTCYNDVMCYSAFENLSRGVVLTMKNDSY